MTVCRKIAFILAVCLFVSLLPGCAVEDDKPYVPTGNALVMDDDSTVVTDPPKEEAPHSLTLGYYPDRSLNPLTCNDFTNRTLFSLVYQSLFSVDRNYNTEPQLCKYYSISSDMREYTFYLENATFSDGTPISDADVLATLTAAQTSTYYSGRFTHVMEIRAGAEGGIIVKLDTPHENFAMLLDIPILKASEVDAPMPLGTGPYFYEGRGDSLYLRRRSNWWCKANLITETDTIFLVPVDSPASLRDEFQFRDVGVVCANPASDSYADYRCDYELWDCENGMFLYIGCNMRSELFSNDTVRSALTYAIDRDKLAETYYRGFGRSATLPASPQSPYYSHTLAENYTYDGLRFLETLTNTGNKDASMILLVNKDDSLRLRVAREIGQMLTDCGLKVEMKELSTRDYMEALLFRTYDLYVGQTKLSPNMDLTEFFYGWGELSYGNLDDSQLYALCLDALANQGNYYNLHQAVMDDGRLVPVLFCGYAVYASRGLVSDLAPARDNLFYYSLGKTMETSKLNG